MEFVWANMVVHKRGVLGQVPYYYCTGKFSIHGFQLLEVRTLEQSGHGHAPRGLD